VDIFILEREKVSSIPFFSSLFFLKKKREQKTPPPTISLQVHVLAQKFSDSYYRYDGRLIYLKQIKTVTFPYFFRF